MAIRLLFASTLAAVLGVVTSTAPLHAQPSEKEAKSKVVAKDQSSARPRSETSQATALGFKALLKTALQHFENGNYLEAARNFEAAYKINPRPEIVYNVARSYEKALERKKAKQKYQQFVALPGTTAELRTKALQALIALQNELQQQETLSAARKSSNTPAATTPITPIPKEKINRLPEWLLIGSGATAILSGAIVGFIALDKKNSFDQAKQNGASADRLNSLADEADQLALTADVLLASGITAAIAGTILYVVRGDSGGSDLSINPQLDPSRGAASITVGGSF